MSDPSPETAGRLIYAARVTDCEGLARGDAFRDRRHVDVLRMARVRPVR